MVIRVIQLVNEVNKNKQVSLVFDSYQRVMSKDQSSPITTNLLGTLMMFMEKIKSKGSAPQNLINLYKTLLMICFPMDTPNLL